MTINLSNLGTAKMVALIFLIVGSQLLMMFGFMYFYKWLNKSFIVAFIIMILSGLLSCFLMYTTIGIMFGFMPVVVNSIMLSIIFRKELSGKHSNIADR